MECNRDPLAGRKARGPDTPASILGPAIVFEPFLKTGNKHWEMCWSVPWEKEEQSRSSTTMSKVLASDQPAARRGLINTRSLPHAASALGAVDSEPTDKEARPCLRGDLLVSPGS